MLSCFSRVQCFATLWTVAHQAPLFTGFSRQEYWSSLSSPSPGDLPDPGTEPASLASPALAVGFFTVSTTREAPGWGQSITNLKQSVRVRGHLNCQSDLLSCSWRRERWRSGTGPDFLCVTELWKRLNSQPSPVFCAKDKSLVEKEWDCKTWCRVVLVDELKQPDSLVLSDSLALSGFTKVTPTLHCRKRQSPFLEDYEKSSNIMLVFLRFCPPFASWLPVLNLSWTRWACAGKHSGSSDYMFKGYQDPTTDFWQELGECSLE